MFLKSNIIIIIWTFLSRVSGFVRDATMAHFIGSSTFSDCIVAASRVPNSFRRLLGEGSVSSIFTPIFSSYIAKKQNTEAKNFQNQIFSLLLLILLVIVIICEIFTPEIIAKITPGFVKNHDKFQLTVNLARINFIALIFICLGSLCGASLNGLRKFGYFAGAPILLNLATVLGFILCNKNHTYLAYANAIIFTLSSFITLIFLIFICKKFNYPITLQIPKFTKETMLFLRKLSNGIIGSGIYQINIFIDSIFASMFGGGISYLYYTDRLIYLPLTLIGGTLSLSLLQYFSHHITTNETKEVNLLYNKSLLGVVFFFIITFIAIFVFSTEITSLVYKRGAFTSNDAIIVAKMMKIFSIGMIFAIITKIYNAFLFAKLNSRAPMIIGILTLIINSIVNFLTYKTHGYFCVAYATTCANFSGFMFTFLAVSRYKILKIDRNTYKKISILLFISLIYYLILDYLHKTLILFINPTISMLLCMVIFGLIYLVIGDILKIFSLKEVFFVIKNDRNK